MSKGRFGQHGGQYIPETLMNEIHHLEEAYEHYKNDPEFVEELDTPSGICRQTVTSLLCRKDDERSGRCQNIF